MFAGIVEGVGRILSIAPLHGRDGQAATRLEIDPAGLLADLPPGASVAVNGACLTLVAGRPPFAAFDVIPETLRLTNLGGLLPGARVNLERSLRVGDRIDGHFVQGHIDGLGTVTQLDRGGGEWRLWVEYPPALAPLVVRKGSVAIDGVSLTIAETRPKQLCVALIPTTLERTTLADRRPGDAVNLETDMLARLIVQRLDQLIADKARDPSRRHAATDPADPARSRDDSPDALTLAQLQQAGFV